MHEVWSLGSNSVTSELHTKEQVDIGAGTVRQFLTDYLTKNGNRIVILGQISINGSVEFLGILIYTEPVEPCLLRISWLPIIPHSGERVVPPIRTGPLSWGEITTTYM